MFRGQIVAISVATGLIGLILLREWIAQQEWHARPPTEEEDEIDLSQWAFRHGQAIRLTDLVHSEDGESNRADAGDDIGDTGDAETIIADGDQEPTAVAYGDQEDIDLSGDSSGAGANGSPERKPARPVLSHAAFDASRRVGETSSRRSPLWVDNAEAGPSRGFADVPEDVAAETPSASTQHLQPLHAAGNESPRGGHTYHDEDFFEALETVSGGASHETTPEFSPSYRRASDPGPDGNSLESPRAERQFGSQGLMDPALPNITESPPDSPLDAHQALDARMGALLGVPEGAEGPSSPDSVGTPETGEFEDEEDGTLGRPTSPTDLLRTETEEMETDVDADQETDAMVDLDAEMDPIDDMVEVEDPQWRQWEVEGAVGDEDDGFVVNVEMVQQVMARNELEGVGMDIPPDDEDDRPLDAEDWDGIFEVVGFIGPLTGLLHNVSYKWGARMLTRQHIFVSFAMAFTLTVLVGLPVLIGKIVLSTDFIRASGDAFMATIRSVSFVSDCITFAVMWILKELLAFPRFIAKPATDYLMEALNVTSSDIGHAFNFTTHIFSHSVVAPDVMLPTNYTVELPVVGVIAEKTIDGLELLGETAHKAYKAMRLVAISVAASPDASDQLLSLVVGYLTLSISVLCVAIIDAANLLQLSHSFMEKARNVQTFLKVCPARIHWLTPGRVLHDARDCVLPSVRWLRHGPLHPTVVWCHCDSASRSHRSSTIRHALCDMGLRHSLHDLFCGFPDTYADDLSSRSSLLHSRSVGPYTFACQGDHGPPGSCSIPKSKSLSERAYADLQLAVSATMYTVVVFAACGAVPWLLGRLSGLRPFNDFLPLRLDQYVPAAFKANHQTSIVVGAI